jgi:polyhydroxybutyrate depolymerase
VLLGGSCSSGDDETSSTTASTTAPMTPSTQPAASPACATATTAPSITRLDVTVDGTARSALVHLPSTATGTDPLPVVLSFHGAESSAAVQQATDGLTTTADTEGFVVVYPEGLRVDLDEQVTDVPGWDVAGQTVDEPAFVAALLDELGNQVCIDPSRVYATGFSNGGHLVLALPCALPGRIAAVAPVEGWFTSAVCETGPATPTIAFHGLDEIAAPFDGAQPPQPTVLPALDVYAAQAARNGCTDEPTGEAITPTVDRLTWDGCQASTILYTLDDHGHAWPGHPLPATPDQVVQLLCPAGEPPADFVTALGVTCQTLADNLLLTNTDIDATDLMWAFFSQNT